MGLLNYIIAIFSLLSVFLLWKYNWILFIILIALASILLYSRKSKKEVLMFILFAIGGAVAEIIAMLSGAWVYTNPNLFSIPIWLPVLWGIAGICIGRYYSKKI